jgi:Spy/CpxP family protein refolding chaperone
MKTSARWFPVVLFTLALAMVLASSASAQDRGPRRGFGGRGGFDFGGGGTYGLLRMSQVQKELELVKDQQDKLRKIEEEMRGSMRELFSGLRDLSEEDRRKKFAEIREKMTKQREVMQKKVDGILLPHQRDRLKQISLQMRMQRSGATSTLTSDTVTEALGITEAQKKKLAEVRKEVEKQLQEDIAKARENARKKIFDVLTPEQRKKLEKLTGEAFKLDRSQFQRGRGRRDRRPRGEGNSPNAQ